MNQPQKPHLTGALSSLYSRPGDVLDIPMDHAEWMTQRASSIGASEIGAIMGYSPYSTPWDVWAKKTGTLAQTPIDSDAIHIGNHMESWLVGRCCDKISGALDAVQVAVTGVHRDAPCLSASPDGFLLFDDGRIELVEAKAGNVADSEDWQYLASQGEPINLGTKVGCYYLQIQQQLEVWGMDRGWFSVSLNNRHMLFPVERDRAMGELIVSFATRWWQAHVVEGVEPEATAQDRWTQAGLEHDPDDEVELGSEHAPLLEQYKRGSRLEKEGKRLKDEALAKMAQAAGGAGRFTICGRRGGWVVRKGRFSSSRFKRDYPDLYEQYCSENSQTKYVTLFRSGGRK